MKNNVKLAFEPSSIDQYMNILRSGREEHVISNCIKLMKDGGVLYDIGANIGYVTLRVAEHFKDQVQIVAFEPQLQLAQKIAISAQINEKYNCRVFREIIGSKNERRAFYLHSHSVHASLAPRKNPRGILQAEVRTLDSFVDEQKIPAPTVVKIDVEGAELDVIKGASETLRRFKPAIIFECDMNAQRFGYGRNDVVEELRKMGYKRFCFIDSLGNFIDIDKGDPTSDIVALPDALD